ncbi:MAG: hypothetical protein C5B49_13135 [Bdellovibrio sp.]|nr:MAG: hypothetical protein C5B49_13135 [Bdellovibrio sp.]
MFKNVLRIFIAALLASPPPAQANVASLLEKMGEDMLPKMFREGIDTGKLVKSWSVTDNPFAIVTGSWGGTLSRKKLLEKGYQKVELVQISNGDFVLRLIDSAGVAKGEYLINRPPPDAVAHMLKDAEELFAYRPSRAGQAAAWTGHIMKKNLISLLPQSMAFFVAIGAKTFLDLWNYYETNPVAVSDFFVGQKDPVAIMSFYAFLNGQGIASEPFAKTMQEGRLRHVFKYWGGPLSMVAGSITSHVASAWGGLPGVRECMKSFVPGVYDPQPRGSCFQAFKSTLTVPFSTDWGSAGGSLLMGATSLVVQAAALGAIQAPLFKAGSLVAARALRWNIIGNFARTVGATAKGFIPSAGFGGLVGVSIKIALVTTYNLTAFTIVGGFVDEPFSSWVNNFFSSFSFQKSTGCLGTHFAKLAVKGPLSELQNRAFNQDLTWRLGCSASFAVQYARFIEKMEDWREENLGSITAAHQKWLEHVNAVSHQYLKAHMFYLGITDMIYTKKYDNNERGLQTPLESAMPLYGVAIPEKTNPWSELISQDFKSTEADQQTQIHTVGQSMMRNKLQMMNMWADYRNSLSADEKKILNEIATDFASADPQQNAKGIALIRKLAVDNQSHVDHKDYRIEHDYFKQYLLKCLTSLGLTPDGETPKLKMGEGYLNAWAHANGIDEQSVKEGKFPGFPKNFELPGHYDLKTRLGSEYLAASMIWGPEVEKNEPLFYFDTITSGIGLANDSQLVNSIYCRGENGCKGFPTGFRPPRLIPPLSHVYILDQHDSASYRSIYDKKIWIDTDRTPGCMPAQPKCYKTALEWIRDGNLRDPSVAPPGSSENFQSWWDDKVKPAYISTWDNFEVTYEEIIGEFAKVFYGEDRYVKIPYSKSNMSVRNLTRFFYLEDYIPSEIRYFYNGHHWSNFSHVSNGTLESLKQERSIALLILSQIYEDYQVTQTKQPEFKVLAQDSLNPPNDIDFNILTTAAAQGNQWSPLFTEYIKAWDEAMARFELIHQPIPSALTREDRQKFFSRLSTKEMTDTFNHLDDMVKSLGAKFKAAIDSGQLDAERTKLVEISLKSLQNTQGQFVAYGRLINSISYVETHSTEGAFEPSKCIQWRASKGFESALKPKVPPPPGCKD